MKFVLLNLVILLSALTCSCKQSHPASKSISHYDVNKPDKKLELPAILNEISGLTILNGNTIACVQDEKGIAFIYDLADNRISKQLTFGSDGDYEDIAKVGNTLYILRSDGGIIEFSNYNSATPKSKIYETGVPAKDNEGLFYDKSNNRLLIGTKSKIEKNVKGVFSFDLNSKTLNPSPVHKFDTKQLEKVLNNKGIEIKSKKGKLKFKLSALAINPKDENLYVLSASEYLIFVFDKSGHLLEVTELTPQIYKKAEGIAFYENGDMLISNEGDGGKANIVKIKYKK
jgi:hypothetical protein